MKKNLKNNKGVTLLEAVISIFLVFIFIAGFYTSFSTTSLISKKIEMLPHAYSVASSILENFYRFSGSGKRNFNEVDNFENDPSGYFSSENFRDIKDLKSHPEYFVDFSKSVQLKGEEEQLPENEGEKIPKKILKGAEVFYLVKKYTNRKNGNNIALAGTPNENDGFTAVTVKVSWRSPNVS